MKRERWQGTNMTLKKLPKVVWISYLNFRELISSPNSPVTGGTRFKQPVSQQRCQSVCRWSQEARFTQPSLHLSSHSLISNSSLPQHLACQIPMCITHHHHTVLLSNQEGLFLPEMGTFRPPSLLFPHYGKQFNESIISNCTGNRPNEIISSLSGVFNYQIMEVSPSLCFGH